MQLNIARLQSIFGSRLQTSIPLSRFTASRIGGLANALIVAESVDELAFTVTTLWEEELPFLIIGGGSNILVSDSGVDSVVLINRARKVTFHPSEVPPYVLAESGASTGVISRQAATKELGGFEWAAGIPGTIGGAVVGNAGAHGGEIAADLVVAEILQHNGTRELWTAEKLEFEYRSSILKRHPGDAIVLTVKIRLYPRSAEEIEADMNRYLEHRRTTQPPGASMGSMFKNPKGDYAGRLIEAAGLKGTRVGDAEISKQHANFFMNTGQATAIDVKKLIDLAREAVQQEFGIQLELEIELVGAW